jgi:hypothetical protein
MGNNTDFNIGGPYLARTRKMKQAIRVLEKARRTSVRLALEGTSTTTKTGRLARDIEDYEKRLKCLLAQGRIEEFYRVLNNAHLKLITLVYELFR